MPSLQKRHDKEVRDSADYMVQNRSWLLVILLLSLIIGVVISEYLTRGKMSPYFDGGWLTYLIHEISRRIKEFMRMLSEAINAFHF